MIEEIKLKKGKEINDSRERKKRKKLTRVNLLRPRGVGVNRWIVRPTINLAALEIRSKERKGVNTREDDATRRRRFSIARSVLVFFFCFFLFVFIIFLSTLLKLLLYLPRRRPPSIVSPPRSRINFFDNTETRSSYLAKMTLRETKR